MKTLVVLNTYELDNDTVRDLIEYIIIAEEWKHAAITPHDVSTRKSKDRHFLTFVPSEDELFLYEATDIARLMYDGFRVVQTKDRWDFFREVLETHY